MFIHLLILSSLARFSSVYARHNVTVDDRDPAIVYAPPGAWTLSANNSLNAGGAHMLTQNPTATATLTFTGVAIYFMSPKWPYLVNTAISLDSGTPVVVDLVDHSRPNTGEGPETVQSEVVWGASGLSNTQHKLVVSVGAGQPFAIVDTLIYTQLDPEDTATTSTSSTLPPTSASSSSTSESSPPPASTSSAATSSSSKRVLSIALGTVLGVLALLIIAAGFWFCARRRRRPVSEAWTVPGHPYPSNSEMTAAPMTGLNGAANYYNQPYNPYGYGPGGPTAVPVPGMAPIPHPYANATGVMYDQGPQQGYNPWPAPMPNVPQQQLRAPNRYQPNTLSTITENSTPPVGGGTPLAHSPSSPGTEIYHSAASSLPSGSPYANASGELARPSEKPMTRYPPAYTPN
ncbi:hypothetical protein BDZ94DRAFT_1258190 [Collybia nuda]|uniref:Transmembrane protein n=1 Tax=Collybia nuda TaxID=64659 RepID=A0A9P5Y8F7_9AGAR|nr:hypothetical protein BDZ94DRAFT_1258190 [Collybia nuda]